MGSAGITPHALMFLPVLCNRSSDSQKRKHLAPSTKGEKILAMIPAEPDAGSDSPAFSPIAQIDGRDYALNEREHMS
jgi:alkylation response protein AidB-like acyl-CoA dehydrogenase